MSNEQPEPERPENCGECRRFMPRDDKPGHGFCDEWPTVDITADCICHPNLGIKRKEARDEVRVPRPRGEAAEGVAQVGT